MIKNNLTVSKTTFKKSIKRISEWQDLQGIIKLFKINNSELEETQLIEKIKILLYNPRFINFTYEHNNRIVGFISLEKHFIMDMTSVFMRLITVVADNTSTTHQIEKLMLDDAERLAIENSTDGLYVFDKTTIPVKLYGTTTYGTTLS